MDEILKKKSGEPKDGTSKRVFVLIVTIVVVMSVLSIGVMYGLLDNVLDSQGPATWESEDEFLYIENDEIWVGRDGTLFSAVRIFSEGSLEIRDSDMTINLEDMVLWRNHMYESTPRWFDVEPNGELTFVNSSLEILADPRLERAVVSEGQSNENHYPRLSRAVNLLGAEAPSITLDVMWRQEKDRLKVAVQEQPGKLPRVIAVLEAREEEKRTWVHYEIDLSDYIGSNPRLIIFPDAAHDLMISDLIVKDVNGGLPGDKKFSGAPFLDGWSREGFVPFFELFQNSNKWKELVRSHGRLSIIESSISAPPNMMRWYFQIRSHSRYELPSYGDPLRDWNVVEATKGGHIHVRNTDLVMSNSSIVNVPIVVEATNVTISSSSLEGDVCLITLLNCQGTVVNSQFKAIPLDQSQTSMAAKMNGYSQHQWAVSTISDNFTHHMSLEGCAFTGFEMAVEISHAWMSIEDSTFSRISTLAIWDHSGAGLGTWAEINDSNSFIDCDGHHFFRSHDSMLRKIGDWRPGEQYLSSTGGRIIEADQKDLPPLEVFWEDPEYAYLYMPLVSVDPLGTPRVYEELTMNLLTDWGGPADITVNTSIREGTVYVPYVYPHSGESPDPRDLVDEWTTIVTSPENDSFILTLWIETWNVYLTNVNAEIELNDVHVAKVPVLEDLEYQSFFESEWRYRFDQTLKLEEGPSTLRISLSALTNESDEVWEMGNTTYNYFRASNRTDPKDLEVFLSRGKGTVMLDPDTVIDVDHIEINTSNTIWDDGILIVLSESAALTISSVDCPKDLDLDIGISGPGQFEIRDAEMAWLGIYTVGSEVHLSEITSEILVIDVTGHGVTSISDSTFLGIDLWASGNSSLVVENSTMCSDRTMMYVRENSTVAFADCSIFSVEPEYFFIEMDEGTSFDMTDSVIRNVTFGASGRQRGVVFRYSISSCMFEGGEPAVRFFDIKNNISSQDEPYPDIQIHGNTFRGPGTDLMLDPEFLPNNVSDNTFLDGARLMVYYNPFFIIDGNQSYYLTYVKDVDGTIGFWPYEEEEDRYSPYGYFIDVTSDPEGLHDIGSRWLLFGKRSGSYGGGGFVAGFAFLDLSERVLTIESVDWEPVGPMVYDLCEVRSPNEVDDPGSWWNQ